MYENPWQYQGKPIDSDDVENYVGFIYQITNTISGRSYIGKKLFKFTRRKLIKGKKKKTVAESDWKMYYSSSDKLKADVAELGRQHFKREILHFCTTKGELSYLEAKLQFEHDVILDLQKWYNVWISCRVRPSHIKHLLVN